MKLFIIAFIISLGFLSTYSFAIDKNENRNITIVTKLYKDFFEEKNFSKMDSHFSKDIVVYKDFDQPIRYNDLKKHLMEQGEQCVKLKMLPFDQVVVSRNKVVTLYTQNCTDKFKIIHKKCMMAITEINNFQKVSKMWVVTHDENK